MSRSSARGRDRADPAALRQLEEMYAGLPSLECMGLCEQSCGEHVDASQVERRRLLRAGVDLDAVTEDGSCPALSRVFGVGRCSVHAIRPMICRLWGLSDAMPCPHGCVPVGGRIGDEQAMRAMLASLQVGGHDVVVPGVVEVLETCVGDPVGRSLLARLLRGEQTVRGPLFARLAQLRDEPAGSDESDGSGGTGGDGGAGPTRAAGRDRRPGGT